MAKNQHVAAQSHQPLSLNMTAALSRVKQALPHCFCIHIFNGRVPLCLFIVILFSERLIAIVFPEVVACSFQTVEKTFFDVPILIQKVLGIYFTITKGWRQNIALVPLNECIPLFLAHTLVRLIDL